MKSFFATPSEFRSREFVAQLAADVARDLSNSSAAAMTSRTRRDFEKPERSSCMKKAR